MTGTVKYSYDQLVQYARNAGFSNGDEYTAAAIALAESGGNPHAYNPENAANAPAGQGSFGLWQVFLHAHPEFFGHALYDPQVNANDAFAIYQEARSFNPWSTFKSGAYLQYLPSEQS